MFGAVVLYIAAIAVVDLGCKATDMVKSPAVANAIAVFCCVVSAACIGYGTTLIGK